jgi:hypothetical protein
MTRARIVVAVGLIVGVATALMPTSAVAEQRHHHPARLGPHASSHRARDARHHGHIGHHPHFGHHGHHSPRTFVTFFSPPSVVYYPYYSPPPVYYAPPVVYQAPQAYAPAPQAYVPAPAMPRVVEYPTGRYELRGNGVTTPYDWVWIPNPPPAPPAPVEPPPVTRDSTSVAVMPSASREAFRWTDDHGVTTWTDRLDSIPERYRAHVQRLR